MPSQNSNASYYGKLNKKMVSGSDCADSIKSWSANDHIVNGWVVYHQEFYGLDVLIGGISKLDRQVKLTFSVDALP